MRIKDRIKLIIVFRVIPSLRRTVVKIVKTTIPTAKANNLPGHILWSIPT